MKPLWQRMAMAVLCVLTPTSPLFLSGCSMSELWQGTGAEPQGDCTAVGTESGTII